MKRYILTILFISGVMFTASAQEENVEAKDCRQFKNGHFIVKEGLIGKKYIIKRNGKKQVETDPNGTRFVFDVNWVDNCSYTLTLKEIAENPQDIEWQEGQVITVNILETTPEGYRQKSTSNLDNMAFIKEMVKVKPREARDFLKNAEDEELAEDFNE